MTAADNDTAEGNHRLLTYRVDQLEKAVWEIRDATRAIEKCLQALSRVPSGFDSLENRVQAVEMELPTLKLVRNWVIGGVVAVASTVGAAVVALVLR